eukprot:1919583-Prymnesium_polylepis.1
MDVVGVCVWAVPMGGGPEGCRCTAVVWRVEHEVGDARRRTGFDPTLAPAWSSAHEPHVAASSARSRA